MTIYHLRRSQYIGVSIFWLVVGLMLGLLATSVAQGPVEPPAMLMIRGADHLRARTLTLNTSGPRRAFEESRDKFTPGQLAVLQDIVNQQRRINEQLFQQVIGVTEDIAWQQDRINAAIFERIRKVSDSHCCP